MFICSVLPAVSKGVSANMLKASSKRRRTLKQIKTDKEAAAQKEAAIEAKLAMVDDLQQQVLALQQDQVALQQDQEKGQMATNLMSQFINAGVVEHGPNNEFTVNPSPSPSKFKPFEDE